MVYGRGHVSRTYVAVSVFTYLAQAVTAYGIAIGLLAKRETRPVAVRTVLAPLLITALGLVAWWCGLGTLAVLFDAAGVIWTFIAVRHVLAKAIQR